MTRSDPRIEATTRLLRGVAPGIPYVAVIVGMYVLSNGWAAILMYHGGMVAVLSVSGSWATPRMTNAPACRVMLVVISLGCALVGPLLYGMWSIMQREPDLSKALADLQLMDLWWVLFVFYYVTVNPLLEESYWRGFLGSTASRPVVNDGFFAGYHVLVLLRFVTVPWVMVAFAGLVGGAWLWRQLTRECGGLLAPVMTHAVADASLILAAVLIAD